MFDFSFLVCFETFFEGRFYSVTFFEYQQKLLQLPMVSSSDCRWQASGFLVLEKYMLRHVGGSENAIGFPAPIVLLHLNTLTILVVVSTSCERRERLSESKTFMM